MRSPKCIGAVSVAVVAMLVQPVHLVANLQDDRARALLARQLRMTSTDLARIERGEPIARTLAVRDKREVATLGVVRLKITPEFYANRLVDIANFKKHEAVLQVGTFQDSPHIEDLRRLTLERFDIRNLRTCRIDDCDVQLSAEAMERFRHEVDWSAQDSEEQANRLMREILVDYVARYQERGDKALMEYVDQPTPVVVAQEFRSIVDTDMGLLRQFPRLYQHLLDYPMTDPVGMTDLIYWSKEKVGPRVVTSVTHLTTCRMSDESPADFVAASKQIYGSHYFDASLGLTVLVGSDDSLSPTTYLVYLNRSRIDALGGFFGSIKRKLVQSRTRSAMTAQLARMKTILESQFAAGNGTWTY